MSLFHGQFLCVNTMYVLLHLLLLLIAHFWDFNFMSYYYSVSYTVFSINIMDSIFILLFTIKWVFLFYMNYGIGVCYVTIIIK